MGGHIATELRCARSLFFTHKEKPHVHDRRGENNEENEIYVQQLLGVVDGAYLSDNANLHLTRVGHVGLYLVGYVK